MKKLGASKIVGKAQRGFTIVEISVAVAIAGVLLVSAVALVQTVLSTGRANDTVTLMNRVFAQIDKIYANQSDYTGFTLPVAVGAGVFEGFQVNRNANPPTVTSKFDQPVLTVIAPNMPANGANRGYAVTFTGIPQRVCADIVSAADAGGVKGILVQPENAAGQGVSQGGLTLANNLLNGMLGNAAVVKDNGMNSVNIAAMSGNGACGTPNATVAITLVNWK